MSMSYARARARPLTSMAWPRHAQVVLEGDAEPLGWVTGVTTENVENVRLANAGFPLQVRSPPSSPASPPSFSGRL